MDPKNEPRRRVLDFSLDISSGSLREMALPPSKEPKLKRFGDRDATSARWPPLFSVNNPVEFELDQP